MDTRHSVNHSKVTMYDTRYGGTRLDRIWNPRFSRDLLNDRELLEDSSHIRRLVRGSERSR